MSSVRILEEGRGEGLPRTPRHSMKTPLPLQIRAVAEFFGTAWLLIAIVGSGITAERLSPADVGLQLLAERPRHRLGAGGYHRRP